MTIRRLGDVPGVIGKQARIIRTVTATRPTKEWTGTRIWEGQITDAGQENDGSLAVVSVLTATEHTYIALGEWGEDPGPGRRWVTTIEFTS